jgi:hypothetical protein
MCGPEILSSSGGQVKSMSKGSVKLGKFECRQGRNKVSQLSLEHQGEEIASYRARTREPIVMPQHYLCREAENFAIHRRTNYAGHIFVFSDKGSGYDDLIAGLGTALGNPFTSSVNLASPHERACSEMRARVWRARRFRCLRNTAASVLSVVCLRSFSAY